MNQSTYDIALQIIFFMVAIVFFTTAILFTIVVMAKRRDERKSAEKKYPSVHSHRIFPPFQNSQQ